MLASLLLEAIDKAVIYSCIVALQFTYGFNSCLVGKKWMIIVRLGMGYALNSSASNSMVMDPLSVNIFGIRGSHNTVVTLLQ